MRRLRERAIKNVTQFVLPRLPAFGDELLVVLTKLQRWPKPLGDVDRAYAVDVRAGGR